MEEMQLNVRRRRRLRRKRTSRWAQILVLIAIVSAIGVVCWGLSSRQDHTVVVELLGDKTITLEYGQTFQDPGARATALLRDGEEPLELEVEAEGTVDVHRLGRYTIVYTAEYEGRKGSVSRTVEVVDTTPPVIELKNDPDIYTLPGQPYQEEGFTAYDQCDGDLTDRVERQELDGVVTYTVTDSSGNRAQVERAIEYKDPRPPVLTLLGEEKIQITEGAGWSDPGCTAMDNVDGDLTAKIQVQGSVNAYKSGTYVLTYQVTDSYGNTAQVQRTVVVEPLELPDPVEPEGKVIYLTFDDGPREHTEKLLQILDKYQAKATFFVVNNEKYIHLLDDIVQAGHSVGIHSVTHQYSQIYASDEAFFEDLYAMQQIIYEQTGVKTWLMRFPGGSSNRVSMKYNQGIMSRLVKSVQLKGFHYFDWNVDSGDGGGGNISSDEFFNNVIQGIQKKKYPVVLMHDIWANSVDTVERILQWGVANGYTFQALDENSPPCHHNTIAN